MMDSLLSLIPGGKLAALTGIFAAILAAAGWLIRIGRKLERAKVDAARGDGLEAELEMYRDADEFEKQVKDLPEEEKRKEAGKWSRSR